MMRIDRTRLHFCGRLALLSGTLPLLILVAGLSGLRVNLTPSEPLGLWRILPLQRSVAVGDQVFICPPQSDAMRQAQARAYLRSGLCASGYAPLIKTVAALSGQVVAVGRDVTIDGKELDHSLLSPRDGEGRALSAFSGGILPAGEVYLHSDFVGSYDSRYFGPVPASGVLGLAQEVLTYAP